MKKTFTEDFKEYKTFISRGSVLDLAVAVIVGAAFTKIVNSLTNDIIMPLITLMLGKSSLSELSIVLKDATEVGGDILTWNYGAFLQTIIDFLLIATAVFIISKIVKRVKHRLDFSARIRENVQKKLDNDVPLSKRELDWIKKIKKVDPSLVPVKKVESVKEEAKPTESEKLLQAIYGELLKMNANEAADNDKKQHI